MFSSKYSNILTMFLVILIIAIFGIIGYFAYSFLNTQTVNKNANSAVDEFKKATTSINKSNADGTNTAGGREQVANETTNEVAVNPLELLNTTTPTNTVTEQPEEPENKVMMESYEVMGTIKIPKTGIEYPVLDSVTKRSLELSVGIAYGPGLNEVGNTIIYGHNYRNGLFFSNNKKLTNGDPIYITDKTGTTVTYIVYNVYETDGNDATYMQRDTEGRREISLQTCTDVSNDRRIIVWAKEQ